MFDRPKTIAKPAAVMAAVGIMAVLCVASGAPAEVSMQAVVLSGEHAPGTEAGVTFTSNIGDVSLNGSGQVMFHAKLEGPGISHSVRDWGVWAGDASGQRLVARVDDPCPDEPAGTTFDYFSNVVMNGSGQVAFQPFAKNASGQYVHTIYVDSGSGPDRLVGENDHAPGTPAGVTFTQLDYQLSPSLNASGQAAFRGILQGTGVTEANDEGIWIMSGGASTLVARGGDQAAGFVSGVDFWRFDQPRINAYGRTAFSGTGTFSGGVFSAIWSNGAHQMWHIAYTGEEAPGTPADVRFGYFPADFGFNNAGNIVFESELTGPSITGYNDHGIWAGSAYGLTLVARDDDPAPGTSDDFGNLQYSSPCMNGAGEVAFRASAGAAYGIWAGQPGALELVARGHTQAPGVPTGVKFASLNDPAINNTGAVAFVGILEGTGVTSDNDRAVWAQAGDELFLVAREGDSIEVSPGVFKTLKELGYASIKPVGNEEGRASTFNDMGQLALELSFTDGSSGIFLATVTGSGHNTQFDPIRPDNQAPGPDGAWTFDGVSGDGQWFDPPMADSYIYETDGASNFTQVGLPTGLGDADGLYLVSDSVNGSVIVPAGVIHTFPTSVSLFTVTGIDPLVDGDDPLAFPTFLAFDQTTVTFTQTPIPEPATLSLLGLGGLAVLKRRRPKR